MLLPASPPVSGFLSDFPTRLVCLTNSPNRSTSSRSQSGSLSAIRPRSRAQSWSESRQPQSFVSLSYVASLKRRRQLQIVSSASKGVVSLLRYRQPQKVSSASMPSSARRHSKRFQTHGGYQSAGPFVTPEIAVFSSESGIQSSLRALLSVDNHLFLRHLIDSSQGQLFLKPVGRTRRHSSKPKHYICPPKSGLPLGSSYFLLNHRYEGGVL